MKAWDKHKLYNPDAIKNNPGVTKCSGRFVRVIDGKSRSFNCQLRWDHDGECICYSGRKTWPKGNKRVEWEQLSLEQIKNQNENPKYTSTPTEPVLSEAVLKALSLLDQDTNP